MRACRSAIGVALCLLLLSFLALGCGGTPGQILARWTLEVPGAAPHAIEIPARLESELPHRNLKFRLTAAVDLDGALAGHDLELVLPYLPAPVTLRVDGRDALLLGDPGPGAREGDGAPRRWLLPASVTSSGRPLALELEVTHRWTQSAWLDVAPELVTGRLDAARADRNGIAATSTADGSDSSRSRRSG